MAVYWSTSFPYCVECCQEIVGPWQRGDHHIENLPYLRLGQNVFPQLRPLSHHAHQISLVVKAYMSRPAEYRAPLQNEAFSVLKYCLGSQQALHATNQRRNPRRQKARPDRFPYATRPRPKVHPLSFLLNPIGLHQFDLDNAIQHYFELFDIALFRGLLGAKSRTTVVVRQALYGNEGVTLLTLDDDQLHPTVEVTLKRGLLTLKKNLQTLLHEMVHAVMGIYHCHCVECLRSPDRARDLGLTGHGEEWVSLARAVEAAANKLTDGLFSFDLAIDSGVALENEERAKASR